jgi:PST family polysaccharide transporter
MACLFGFLCAQAEPLVELLLGAKWSPIIPLLIALAVGGVFQSVSVASQWMIAATGHGGSGLRLMLVTRTMMITLIILSSMWGTIAVACAYTVSCMVTWVVGTVWAGRVAHAPVAALLTNVLVAATGYSVCSLTSYAAASLIPDDDFTLRIAVGLLAMLTAVALVGLCWPIFRRDLRSAIGVFTIALPGRRSVGTKGPATKSEPGPEVDAAPECNRRNGEACVH